MCGESRLSVSRVVYFYLLRSSDVHLLVASIHESLSSKETMFDFPIFLSI